MKKIYTILTVLALSMITYSVSAQVNVGSVHRYKAKPGADIAAEKAAANDSDFEWKILIGTTPAVAGTDYEIWASYTDKVNSDAAEVGYVIGASDVAKYVSKGYIIYIKWLKALPNVSVQFQERNTGSECTDEDVNIKTLAVVVEDLKFDVTIDWADTKNNKDLTALCAQATLTDLNNTVSFTVKELENSKGDLAPWNFTYDVYTQETAKGVVIDDSKWVKVDALSNKKESLTEKKDVTITVTQPVNTGTGSLNIKVVITDARDGYNTLAKTLVAGTELSATAVINMIPTSNAIITD